MPYIECVCVCVCIVGVLKVFRSRETWLTKENKILKIEKDVCWDLMLPDAHLSTHLHVHRCIHTKPTAVQIRVNIPGVSQQWKSLPGFVQKESFFLTLLSTVSWYFHTTVAIHKLHQRHQSIKYLLLDPLQKIFFSQK